jgi:putative ABC transport system permease protein
MLQTLRSLRRTASFAGAVVITLILGIWPTTVMFSVIDAVLLRPLPLPEGDRLVRIWDAKPSEGKVRMPVSQANLLDWTRRATSFEGLFIADAGLEATVLTVGDQSEQVRGVGLSPDAFRSLGVSPARGRTFTPGDEGALEVVISDALWRRVFNADAGAIGRVVAIEGRAQYTVVGIMPPGFAFPTGADMWRPMKLDSQRREGRFHAAYGRLKPTATLAQARAEMTAIARALEVEYPAVNRGWTVEVESLLDATVKEHETALTLLLAAVVLVLLVACANVASMLMVRGLARQPEVALRLALGATPRAIIRQAMLESVVLASAAGVAALLLLALTLPVIRTLGSGIIPRIEDVRLDGWVLLFAVVLTITSAVISGLGPALRLVRTDPSPMLKGCMVATGFSGRRTAFATLVVIECALATILLVGAVLLVQTFTRLASSEAGFNPQRVLSLELRVPLFKFGSDIAGRYRMAQLSDELIARVRAIPGVVSAATTDHVPFDARALNVTVQPLPQRLPQSASTGGAATHGAAAAAPATEEPTVARYHRVSPDYFRTMEIRLISGRLFSANDASTEGQITRKAPRTPGVAVVNETLAKRLAGGGSVLGRSLSLDLDWIVRSREIVGVVRDVKTDALDQAPGPEVYVPYAQEPSFAMALVVRTANSPLAMANTIQGVIREFEKDVSVGRIRSLDAVASDSIASPRLNAMVFAGFAILALILASVGVYGVVAFVVRHRTREIGLRMAVGAPPERIAWSIIGDALRLAAIGLVLGFAGSLLAGRVVDRLLFGVRATDPLAFSIAALSLSAAAICGSYLPARRAMKLDPVTALRNE